MDLLKRYEAATSPTIAQVKTIGTESSPGVNFLDGVQRTRTPAIDTVQTEFTPNANGSFLYDGNGKVAGTYSLSRWLDAGIKKGDSYLSNTKFTTIVKGDVRNAAGTILHKFSQLQGKSFFDAAGLSPFAKSRANPNSNSYGPGVAGVNG